ncbi:MAG: hypothetical protein ACYCPS_01785 [Candidatus Saccharimonadales bacterium]
MPRSFEFYPGGHQGHEERIFLPYPDEELMAAVVDIEGSKALFDTSPVLWVRSAIAVGSEKKPSDVTDEELVARLLEKGLSEWDPVLTQPLTDYLQDQGFFIFN